MPEGWGCAPETRTRSPKVAAAIIRSEISSDGEQHFVHPLRQNLLGINLNYHSAVQHAEMQPGPRFVAGIIDFVGPPLDPASLTPSCVSNLPNRQNTLTKHALLLLAISGIMCVGGGFQISINVDR